VVKRGPSLVQIDEFKEEVVKIDYAGIVTLPAEQSGQCQNAELRPGSGIGPGREIWIDKVRNRQGRDEAHRSWLARTSHKRKP
jgi:hypothetical protein